MAHYWPVWEDTFDIIGRANLIKTVNSNLTKDRFNNSNSAIHFNCGYSQLSPGVYLSGSFTVTLWIRLIAILGYDKIFEFSNGNNEEIVVLSYSLADSGRPFLRTSLNLNRVISDKALRLGVWEYTAFVLNDTKASIYLNGDLVGQGETKYPTNVIRTDSYIGKGVSAECSKVDFDELKIFNRALSKSEILQDMSDDMSYILKI